MRLASGPGRWRYVAGLMSARGSSLWWWWWGEAQCRITAGSRCTYERTHLGARKHNTARTHNGGMARVHTNTIVCAPH